VAAEQEFAAANARVNALRPVPASPKEELLISNSLLLQASVGHSDKAPDINAPINTPGSNKSLGPLGAGALLSDMATLRHEKHHSRMTNPISDGTPSLLTDSSMSATTSSTSARTSLNASKYPSIPHGHLPVNDSDVVDEDDDMYSLKHRVPLGATGHFWYLSVGIDWIADEDS
jgi:hypothetical protein